MNTNTILSTIIGGLAVYLITRQIEKPKEQTAQVVVGPETDAFIRSQEYQATVNNLNPLYGGN